MAASLTALDVESDNQTSGWKHFVFCSFYWAEHEVTQLIYGARLLGCCIYAANIGFALARSGYVQLLFLSEKRQTILVVSTTTETIPRFLLPNIRQIAGQITACDCMESRGRTTQFHSTHRGCHALESNGVDPSLPF